MPKKPLLSLFFNLSVLAKGLDGILEVIGGLTLFFIPPNQIHKLVWGLTQHELSQDPHDLLTSLLLHSTNNLSHGTTTFASIYLLLHGAVKVVLVVGLLRKWRWSYPAAMIVFSLFVLYQQYRYAHTHSAALIVLSVLDGIIIILTWFEYKRLVATNSFAVQSNSKKW